MGKYPIEISEERNAKLKYPFLPTEQYDKVIHNPGGSTILIRYSDKRLTKEDVQRMIEINEKIAYRVAMEKQAAN
ncbi:MAG TPA: hypothetical protein VHR42_04075 [Clostridia bacterium]|nr:hypothetical protein [Clostridia bacterium]